MLDNPCTVDFDSDDIAVIAWASVDDGVGLSDAIDFDYFWGVTSCVDDVFVNETGTTV